MAYLQLETMREVTESEIRSLYPNTSFTTPFVAPEGFEWVFPTPSPTITELQVAVRDGVEKDSKGNWVEKWLVRDMFADTTDEEGVVTTKAEHEAAYLLAKFKATVPSEVAMWKARAVLEQAGFKDQIDAALANDVVAKNKWEYATVVKRDDATIAAMATLLNLTDAMLDQLFIEASKL